jgi:hypothetical protein
VAPSPGPQPMSASGCNSNVCIYVGGTGLIVNSWETTGYYGGTKNPFCTYAAYWAPTNVLYETSVSVCAGPGTYYSYLPSAPVWFPNNTQICNTFVGISGKPCKTVHS